MATFLLAIGIVLGGLVAAGALLAGKARTVPTWTCGETQPNDEIIVPGTGFYKTVSQQMPGLKTLYAAQEKERFDPYNHTGKTGLAFTSMLRALHTGMLPTYLTWVVIGLVAVLFVICNIW